MQQLSQTPTHNQEVIYPLLSDDHQKKNTNKQRLYTTTSSPDGVDIPTTDLSNRKTEVTADNRISINENDTNNLQETQNANKNTTLPEETDGLTIINNNDIENNRTFFWKACSVALVGIGVTVLSGLIALAILNPVISSVLAVNIYILATTIATVSTAFILYNAVVFNCMQGKIQNAKFLEQIEPKVLDAIPNDLYDSENITLLKHKIADFDLNKIQQTLQAEPQPQLNAKDESKVDLQASQYKLCLIEVLALLSHLYVNENLSHNQNIKTKIIVAKDGKIENHIQSGKLDELLTLFTTFKDNNLEIFKKSAIQYMQELKE